MFTHLLIIIIFFKKSFITILLPPKMFIITFLKMLGYCFLLVIYRKEVVYDLQNCDED